MNKVFLKLCDLGFGVNTPLTEQQNSHLPELFQTRALEKWYYINNVWSCFKIFQAKLRLVILEMKAQIVSQDTSNLIREGCRSKSIFCFECLVWRCLKMELIHINFA